MRKSYLLCLVFFIVVFFAGCFAGPNTSAYTAGEGSIAGFWLGLWHGMISPGTFIISLFSDSVNFYEVHNNGGWYNFGFVLGSGILFGGAGASSRKS